jgi:SAM-dependent methyltransferase
VTANVTGINHEQIEFWNGPRGAAWAAEQELRDRSLAPFGEAALQAAAVAAGERVIDVGCGCGASTLELARAVGPSGSVIGVDVSAPMLARARERAARLPQVSFFEADAATHELAGNATLLFSRFGVMFFADPLGAFENLRRALAPGGRLAFVCWRSLADNGWMALPFAAAKRVISTLPPSLAPDAPGPLAFADAARTRSILERAGFSDLTFSPFDHPMPLGDRGGLEAAAAEAVTIGPTARLLADASDEQRAEALAAIRAALAPHAKGNVVELPAGAWVVTGRVRPAQSQVSSQ